MPTWLRYHGQIYGAHLRNSALVRVQTGITSSCCASEPKYIYQHYYSTMIALCSHRRFPDHAGRQMPSFTGRTERTGDSGQNAWLAALRSQFRAMIALCSHRMLPDHAGRQMPSFTGRTECACDSCQNACLATLRSQCKSFPVNRHNLHNCSNICHKSFTGKR